jgi:hypothetical protein
MPQPLSNDLVRPEPRVMWMMPQPLTNDLVRPEPSDVDDAPTPNLMTWYVLSQVTWMMPQPQPNDLVRPGPRVMWMMHQPLSIAMVLYESATLQNV